jgi:hypothetical protein
MHSVKKSLLTAAVLLSVAGCITGTKTSPAIPAQKSAGSSYAFIQPLAEQVYQNHKALNRINENMQLIAKGYIYKTDEQLNYIQKAYLLIAKSDQASREQWGLLSSSEYIKDEYLHDYFALRLRGLRRALTETAQDLSSLLTYQAFIENEAASNSVDEAIGLLREKMDLFGKIITLLVPVVDEAQK